MSSFKVAIGPMSHEIVEATFHYSHTRGVPLALIATKNQIGYHKHKATSEDPYPGGYVEGWNTGAYSDFLREMRRIYPHATVDICRDHCGPGFDGFTSLADVHETIANDIHNEFDLIHIDFCKMAARHDDQISEAIRAIDWAKRCAEGKGRSIRFEIGTDEIHAGPPDIDRIKSDLDRFLAVCTPEFYVINTGSLTLENRQVGTFNHFLAKMARELLASHGIKLKEHNADWLTPEQIQSRCGCVDAVNIAPELGVRQTQATISALGQMKSVYFRKVAFEGEKWRKWLLPTTELCRETWDMCIEAAGHYHFASQEYQVLRDLMGRENLIAVAEEVIDRYVQNLK